MHPRLLSFAALLLATAAAHADGTFERTFSLSSQPDLYVQTNSGNIHVTPGGDGQIHVVGHVHAGWNAFGDVKSRIASIVDHPPVTQSGNEVRVGEVTDHTLLNNISIDYDITAPTGVALNVHSGSGDITIDGLGRFLSASSGSGNVRAHGIHGPADLGSGSGDIELEEGAPGDVKAKTGSGNIRLHNLNGSLNARTGSGDIEAEGRLINGGAVATGSGSVRLHLSGDSRFNLEASTGSGNLHVHMPGTDESNGDGSRHHLTVSVNGGGTPLEVRTGSGDVEINSR